MFGAIIQAIDHAMERTQKGMSAGIDVANSQHGGAAGSATTSNEQVDTSKTGENIKNATDGTVKQELGAKAKAGGSAGSGVSEGANASAGANAAAGSGALPEGIASSAGSILSDEKAKESKSVSAKTAAENTVSGWRKARNYGTNVSKGFANAGAIATGQGKQYDVESPSIVDFNKDITKDFKAESTNIKKSK